MTITTGTSNITIYVWHDPEWNVWMWLSDTDAGICA